MKNNAERPEKRPGYLDEGIWINAIQPLLKNAIDIFLSEESSYRGGIIFDLAKILEFEMNFKYSGGIPMVLNSSDIVRTIREPLDNVFIDGIIRGKTLDLKGIILLSTLLSSIEFKKAITAATKKMNMQELDIFSIPEEDGTGFDHDYLLDLVRQRTMDNNINNFGKAMKDVSRKVAEILQVGASSETIEDMKKTEKEELSGKDKPFEGFDEIYDCGIFSIIRFHPYGMKKNLLVIFDKRTEEISKDYKLHDGSFYYKEKLGADVLSVSKGEKLAILDLTTGKELLEFELGYKREVLAIKDGKRGAVFDPKEKKVIFETECSEMKWGIGAVAFLNENPEESVLYSTGQRKDIYKGFATIEFEPNGVFIISKSEGSPKNIFIEGVGLFDKDFRAVEHVFLLSGGIYEVWAYLPWITGGWFSGARNIGRSNERSYYFSKDGIFESFKEAKKAGKENNK